MLYIHRRVYNPSYLRIMVFWCLGSQWSKGYNNWYLVMAWFCNGVLYPHRMLTYNYQYLIHVGIVRLLVFKKTNIITLQKLFVYIREHWQPFKLRVHGQPMEKQVGLTLHLGLFVLVVNVY